MKIKFCIVSVYDNFQCVNRGNYFAPAMAETENVKTMENLNKDKNERNGIESINDSGIEMNEEKEKMERNLTIKCPWILGQLAWARGSSYPFWPCVVTLDPTTLLYFKVQSKYYIFFSSEKL